MKCKCLKLEDKLTKLKRKGLKIQYELDKWRHQYTELQFKLIHIRLELLKIKEDK